MKKEELKGLMALIGRFNLLKPVMNVKDVAEYTGFSTSYIYKLTSQREIPHYKLHGRALFFKRSELEAWLTKNRIAEIDQLLENSLYNLKK